jgi:hypothetical protein
VDNHHRNGRQTPGINLDLEKAAMLFKSEHKINPTAAKRETA